MAYTYVYGTPKTYGSHLYTFRAFLGYEVTTDNETTYAVKIIAGMQVGNNNGAVGENDITMAVSGTGQTSKSTSWDFRTSDINGSNTVYSAFTWTWTKTKAQANKEIAAAIAKSGYLEQSRAAVTLPVPAKKSKTVSYNANGGSGAPSAQTKWYGEALTLSTTKPTKTGCTFVKWNTKSDGSGTSYSAGASYTNDTGTSVTLYAVWKTKTYTVSYKANGGSGTISSQTKTHGVALTLSKGTGFSRTNYKLTGWATSSGGNKAYDLGGSLPSNVNQDLTLYAVWTLEVTAPTITSANAIRCDSGGAADNEGKYIKVSFNYTGGTSGGTAYKPTCVITIDGTPVKNAQLSSASGSLTPEVYGSSYATTSAHTVTITLSNTFSGQTVSKTVTKTVSKAIYPLDFLSDGTNLYMGLMTSAEDGMPLLMKSPLAKETGARYEATDGNLDIWFGLSTNGIYQGIYDRRTSKYLLRDDGATITVQKPLVTTENITSGGDVEDSTGKLLSLAPQVKYASLSGSASKTFTLPSASRGILVTIGATTVMTMYLYIVTTAGAITTTSIKTATNISLSNATNALTVTNESTATTHVYFITLSGDLPD